MAIQSNTESISIAQGSGLLMAWDEVNDIDKRMYRHFLLINLVGQDTAGSQGSTYVTEDDPDSLIMKRITSVANSLNLDVLEADVSELCDRLDRQGLLG